MSPNATNIEQEGVYIDNFKLVDRGRFREKELYDLAKDPDELTNIAASASTTLLATLHQRLDDLRTCKADACRSAESKPLDLTS